jgi:hypothetical protein
LKKLISFSVGQDLAFVLDAVDLDDEMGSTGKGHQKITSPTPGALLSRRFKKSIKRGLGNQPSNSLRNLLLQPPNELGFGS